MGMIRLDNFLSCKQIYNRQIMFESKITFPRLKAYSQRSMTQTRTTKAVSQALNTITSNNTSQQRTATLEEKLNTIKLQYVNKSPHYFKVKNRSVENFVLVEQPMQSIEEFVGEHSRVLDKQLLLQLAKKRIQRHQRQKYAKQGKLCEQEQGGLSFGRSIEEPRTKNTQQSMKQSKYQNFRPLRIPLRHNIKYAIQHGDLRLKATIS